MANFLELIFVAHLIITLGVTLYKTYNLLNKGEIYNLATSFMLFILFTFGWFLGLVIVLTDPISISSNLAAYSTLFIFTSGFFLLNILYTIIELILALNIFSNKEIKAYNSFKEYKINYRWLSLLSFKINI